MRSDFCACHSAGSCAAGFLVRLTAYMQTEGIMGKKAPVLFTGHGSPMNAIGENRAREGWKKLSGELVKPAAIAAVSAHWQTRGICVRTAADNPQIYDMYGFPEELYRVLYAPEGNKAAAEKILQRLGPKARADNSWGIDHGVWSVLSNLFPGADVPVIMISVDASLSPEEQYENGKKLSSLRGEGIMLLASGNIVHNLSMVDWNMTDGCDWAKRFDSGIKQCILEKNHNAVLRYREMPESRFAVPTAEHFSPIFTALGAVDEDDGITVFNDYCELGSMSMTSYLFGF